MRLLQSDDQWAEEVQAADVVVAISREELGGIANCITEALQAVEDWEFGTLVGLLPEEAKALRGEIGETLRATFRPE